MEQTKRSWTVKFLITAIFAFVTALTLGFSFMLSNAKMSVFAEDTVQTRPEDGVWHDQYVDRSAIQVGDVFYADKTSIHIFNDMHTTIQAGDHEEVVDWKIALREDGIVTEHYEIPWDGEIVVPFGKVYTYRGTVFDVTNVSGTLFTSGTCIARLDNGVLTVGSKTGNDASMDDHEAGNRAEWCIQPFNSYITKVVVLDKVTWIGDYAFWNLPNLKEVEIASSVSVIGNYAFSGSGLETIVIPDTVTSLYSHIFDGCSKLKNVTLPKGANVGDGTFANCGSITNLDIFDGVNRFGSGAFSGCSGLVDVTMPNSVTAIGNSCFSGCGNLKRLVFSDNLKKVPNSVCNGCGNLEEVVIGSGVTYIENFAFAGCNKLEKAFFNRPSEPNDGVTFAGPIDPQHPVGLPFESCTKLYYTGEPEYMGLFWGEWFREEGIYLKDIQKLYAYVNDKLVPPTLPWLNKNEIATDYSGDCEVVRNWQGVATVRLRTDGGKGNDGSGRMADGYCNWAVGPQHIETTGVIIEDGVTHIGAESFSYNYIEFVTLGADVESIGNFAFAHNPTTEINFNSKLKTIGEQAFYENAYLTEITFSDSITSIGREAFCKCFALKTAVMPKNLEVLGGGAFEECRNLKGVMTFPKTVTIIGDKAFSGTGVSEVNLEKYDKDFNPEYNGLRGMTVHMYGTGNAKLFRLSTGTEIIDGGNMGAPGIMTAEYIWRVPADYESGDCLIHFDGMYVTVKKNPNSNGNGEMADYANLEDRPWHDRIQDIIAIDFEEGITRIGDRVFKGTGDHKKFDIKYINLPETGLKTIGDEALQGYLGSVEMRFASSVTHIGNNAIGGKYFRQAIFICPDERSTLTLGENAFVDGLFGFERTGSMILYDDEDRVEGEWLENHTNRTLIWRDELYRVANRLYDEESDWYYYDDFYNVLVNDRETLNAGVGDLVTITLTPLKPASFEDREIKTVSVVKRKYPISSIQEFVEIIGDNEIVGDDNMVVKVIDDRIVLVKDNEIIYEITDDYSLIYYPSGNTFRYYLYSPGHSDKPTWDFNFGMLSLDVLYVRCDGFNFEGYGNVTTKERDVEITKVSENVYSFIMPDGWAILYATEGKPLPPPAINQLSNNCELFFTNSENKEINQAKPGEMVTITIDANPNYIFEKIFAYVPYNSVTGISQIATLMGKAIFEGVSEPELNADFSGLYCKVNENGNFVVMNGNEIVAELVNGTMTNDEDHEMLFTTFTDDENMWSFIFERGTLRAITVQNKETEEYIFAGEGEVDGILGREIELTEIEKGIEYTFIMPNTEILVVANYIKTYNINVEETENGNITTTIEGNDDNYAKQNDIITITVEPEQGYMLKELSVLIRDAKVKNIEQLKAAMGNAVFTSEDKTKTCMINESGNFVLIRDGNVIAEITEISGFGSRTDPMQTFSLAYIDSNGYDWTFEIRNGILIHIQVSNIFSAYGEGAGKFEASEEKIPLTTVIDGSKYAFTMPNNDVKIVAMYEEYAGNMVTFNANDGTGSMSSVIVEIGQEFTLPVCSFTAPEGKVFKEWLVVNGEAEAKNMHVGEKITVNGNVTLTAVWMDATPINPTVTLGDWTYGENANTPVVAGNDGNGEVTFTYYTDENCTIKTTTDNGANAEGEIPTNAGTYYVKATIKSNGIYASGSATTTFTIQKAMPEYTKPENQSINCNQTLKDITLGNGFALTEPNQEIKTGENEVKLTFTPEDTTNYEVVENITIIVTKLDHTYQFVEFVWTDFTAQAKCVCEHDKDHVVYYDAKVTNQITTPATCEKTGIRTYTASYDGHTDTKEEVVNALNHNYQFVEFVWTDFNAQAKYVCEHDKDHVVFYDATVTNEVTTNPTCEETGIRTYTATYENYTDTKTEVIKALNHIYQFVEFVWADDFTAQAKYVCERNEEHVVFYDATITSEVTVEPTYNETGIKTYTASYDGHTDTKTEVLDILNHKYNFVEFVWNEFTAQAKYTCEQHDGEHVKYYNATVISEITTAPTCEKTGVRTYTASYDGHTSTKEEVVDALNHNYQFVEFVWNDFKAQAKYVCENDNDHVVFYDTTITSEVTTEPTCEETGIRTYTANYDGHTDTKTEVIEALNHNYNFVEFAWNGYEAQAKYVCGRDEEHIVFYDATITSEVTKAPTYKETGIKTYTASYDGHTDLKTEEIAKLVPETKENGDKVYTETITEEKTDVTDLFAEAAKVKQGVVEIKAENLTLAFDNNAVSVIAGSDDVKITLNVLTENTGVENAELVIEVTLEGATSQFGNGTATLTVPFEKEVPAGKIAKVYYIDKNGDKTDMNATFENGKVTFVTNHFSIYAVMFENAAVANSGLSGGAIVGIVLGVVALLALCGFALVWFVIKKKTWADLLVLFKKK